MLNRKFPGKQIILSFKEFNVICFEHHMLRFSVIWKKSFSQLQSKKKVSIPQSSYFSYKCYFGREQWQTAETKKNYETSFIKINEQKNDIF